MHKTGIKNKAGRTQDFPLYTQERIILDMQNKDIQLSATTNEEEERGSAGPEKGLPRNNSKKGIARRQKKSPASKKETGDRKTATTYSPTCAVPSA